MALDLQAVFALSPAEKLKLVQDLWDDLLKTPDEIPVPEGLLEELDRRKARLEADPSSASTWEDVKERIRERHASRASNQP